MQKTLLKIAAVLDVVTKLALWMSGAGLVLMTVFIAWQVFGRFVLNDTPTWTETMSTLLMGWMVFLGSAVGVRRGYHLSFDIVLYMVPDHVKKIFRSISDIAIICFSSAMAYYGYALAAKTWNSTIPNLGWSGGFVFLALIAGGILMALFSLERLVRRASGLPTMSFGGEEEMGGAN